MWSVNMQHFLDEKGSTDQIPVEAKVLADYFGKIVTVVTLDYTGLLAPIPDLACRNLESPGCTGGIVGYFGQEDDRIEWFCNECEDSGVITGWEDTLWDCVEIALQDL